MYSWFLLAFFLGMLVQVLPLGGGMPSPFTKVPPSVLYVVRGKDARMEWDYSVSDKNTEFASYSPTWYYQRNTSKIQLAFEYKWSNPKWQWSVASTCPERLKSRISKESTATLLILNVTTADNGIYECELSLIGGETRSSKAELFVTDQPTMLSKSQDQIINETSPLHLTCIADGYPAPNISWTKSPSTATPSVSTGNKYSIQSAKRTDAGTYTCTASNGIGKGAVANIQVTVQYKAEIDASKSTKTLDSWKGKHIRLQCSFIGNPAPRISWYKPSGSKVTSPYQRTTSESGISELNMTTTSPEDYGKYKCFAANVVGTDEHFIVVKQLFTPYQPEESHMISDSKGTQVTIFWCVPGVKGGTPVIDYKVEINSNPPREMITKYTFAEIKDLKENTKYTVKVYARNKAGYGDPVERVIVTGNPENFSTFVVASLSTILAISLLTNALFVFIIIKVQRKEREGKHRFHKPTKNISYENKTDVEMEDIAHDERDHPTDTNRDGISNQIETSSGALEDNASHYQSLSSATRRPVEARPPQLYEPLITKADKPQQSEYASLQINSRSNPKAVEGKQSPESKDQ